MELAQHGSLRDFLSDTTTDELPWTRRLAWLSGIAAGMAELHAQLPNAIVHRDLKAANVLLADGGMSCEIAGPEKHLSVHSWLHMLLHVPMPSH